MAIDLDEVRRIAELARLELDASGMRALGRQLGEILDYVAMLDELDVSRVPPTAFGVTEAGAMREDEPVDGLPTERALGTAPDSAAGHFRVPRVLEE